MHRMLILILLGATLLGFTQAASAEVAVVAHTEVQLDGDGIDAATLQAFYLGKKRTWPGGSHVVLTVNHHEAVHASFLGTYIGKSPSNFTNFWKRMVFTGQGKMPESFDNDSAVIDFVARTPGAIGYVDQSNVNDSVMMVSLR